MKSYARSLLGANEIIPVLSPFGLKNKAIMMIVMTVFNKQKLAIDDISIIAYYFSLQQRSFKHRSMIRRRFLKKAKQ